MTRNHFVNWETLELIVRGPYDYEIDLERCRTPAQLLDWIYQIANKEWCTPEMLMDLLLCFDEAAAQIFPFGGVQGAFCPGGRPHKVDWATGKTEPL